MAALRRRRTDDANVSEPADEAQATLDFGSTNESETTQEPTTEPQETAQSAESADEPEAGKVVVKRRRVVKKTEETETAESNSNTTETVAVIESCPAEIVVEFEAVSIFASAISLTTG